MAGAPPRIESFTGAAGTASADGDSIQIRKGETVTLRWTISGAADRVSVNGRELDGSSELAVHPADDALFVLSAESAAGTARATFFVDVLEPGEIASPHVSVAETPQDEPLLRPSDLPPRGHASCALLSGMIFDTEKCFLLPSGLTGIKSLRVLHGEHPGCQVLVVGHADSYGARDFNRTVSRERAQAITDFLTANVDGWIQWYDAGVKADKRWGAKEDQLMLSHATDENWKPFYTGKIDGNSFSTIAAIKAFQQCWELTVDGAAGAMAGHDQKTNTRRALIAAYMHEDQYAPPDYPEKPALPAGTVLKAHGCGESHPIENLGDEKRSEKNRRVEIFLFEGAVAPAPQAQCPDAGCGEYAQWIGQVVEKVDLSGPPLEKWTSRWDGQARMGQAATMVLSAPGLAAGEPVTFEVTQEGLGTVFAITVPSQAGSAQATFDAWFDFGRATYKKNLSAGQSFPAVKFTFEARVASGRRALAEPIAYDDFLQGRLTGPDGAPLAKRSYVVYTNWGRRKGKTSAEGKFKESGLPPGGATIVLGDVALAGGGS